MPASTQEPRPELAYEPPPSARPVVVEHHPGTTQIVVPLVGLYAPTPRWVRGFSGGGLYGLAVVAVVKFGVLVVRMIRRSPRPPRAVFEVTADRFRLGLLDRNSGQTHVTDCPRSAVVEARANRYSNGLWLDITGHVKDTVLADLSRRTITDLAAALAEAFADQDQSADVE